MIYIFIISALILLTSIGAFISDAKENPIANTSDLTPTATPTAIDLHREFLARKGINYKGTTTKKSRNRSTHCYSCKNTVSSDSNVACSNCGWLICDHCGTCGCGRIKSK